MANDKCIVRSYLLLLNVVIGAMTAAALTTVSSLQQIRCGEDQQPILQVIVQSLYWRRRLVGIVIFAPSHEFRV